MSKRMTAAPVVALVSGAMLIACGGDGAEIVAPGLPATDVPFGVVANPEGVRVQPAERQWALTSDLSWSFDAGPEGKVVRNVVTGLTISIPQGALSEKTHITVSALKGSFLGYRFEPHGLQFAAPVELSQSLRGLKFKRDALGVARLLGGYFPGEGLTPELTYGTTRVVELLPVLLDVKTQRVTLQIRHFSGYTVASAYTDPSAVSP